MATSRKKGFFEDIFDSIYCDDYLLELYDGLLRNYTRLIFGRAVEPMSPKNVVDLLKFAEFLANSPYGSQKVWAQQIVALLDKLIPGNGEIVETKRYVLLTCTNYKGLGNEMGLTGDFLDDLSNEVKMESLRIPNTENEHFFAEQKEIYDSFGKEYCSYSAPTSMGKSFVMRVFLKEQIRKGLGKNYAIIVPTKALISEVKMEIMDDMSDDLAANDYRIITAVGDLALTAPHNFIYVMTPERMLYLANNDESLKLDYMFVDEAHKISSKDSRSPLYYDLVKKFASKEEPPHIFFSSPNIPNPEVYLKLLEGADPSNKIHVSFSPVSQIKYLIDLHDGGSVQVYNDFSKKFIKMGNSSKRIDLNFVINEVGRNCQNLIYCASIDKTMTAARKYADTLPYRNDAELDKLSKNIANEIHDAYFLVDMVKKGVAFHVGYLPENIRSQVEKLYKTGKINSLFCTSTLIEGVNLPADNLFITSYKAGLSSFNEVSFRNLIGRVGRIRFNLFGNVFLIRMREDKDQNSIEKYTAYLQTDIPPQQLAAESLLGRGDKRDIVIALSHGDYEISNKLSTVPSDKFDVMRKFQLILKNDIKDGHESAVMKAFAPYMKGDDIEKIRTLSGPDNKSIDISPDQYRNMSDYIRAGHGYPNTHFDYEEIVSFLETLNGIFKWRVYEKKTLGNWDKQNDRLTHVRYYATLLLHWMKGDYLAHIIKSSINYKERHPYTGVWLNSWKVEDYYNRLSIRHVNYVIADTLNSLDKVILFKIANYFREFSTEYKRVNGISGRFPNDWYEYVEYGTTDDIIITLQQCGFEREEAQYIKRHGLLDFSQSSLVAKFTIKKDDILKTKNENVAKQAKEAIINVPELFI